MKAKILISFKIQILIVFLVLIFVKPVFSQTNLISNGNFETGTSGWTSWGATLTSSTDAHSGSGAAKISNRKNPWDAIVRDLKSVLVNGQSYNLSAWVKIPDPAVNFRATLALNVDGVTSYLGYLWNSSPVIGSYAFYSEQITVSWTGNLVSANLYFETEKVGSLYSDYIIDDVVLTELAPGPGPVLPGFGLKSIKSTMLIGGCVTDGGKTYFSNATAKEQVLNDCNTVTVQCYPAWGRWDETQMHVYHPEDFSNQVKEMKQQKMVVTAHMLLGWDQYFPNWYKNNDFSPDTLDAIMKSWLSSIIENNGNDTLVDIWNVVNEAISWNGKGGYWAENNPDHINACEMQRMGYEPDSSGLTGKMFVNSTHPVYIRKAFEYARTLTSGKLELRDSNFEFPTDSKYNAFYQLAVHLKKVGAPVDVIGFQTHLDLEKIYDWEAYTNNIRRYVKLGYQVNIPEVDIGDVAKSWSDEKAELQKNQYYRLVMAAIKGGASDLQTWGFNDENNSTWRSGEKAFPYSYNFTPKPAYFGIREALTDMSHILFWEMDLPVNDTMPDVMKYNNYGTLNNFGTPVIVNGFKNKALKFDGTNDFISTGVLSDTISGDMSFSCFVNTSTTKAGIIAEFDGEAIPGLTIGINSAGIISLSGAGSGLINELSGSVPINDGLWHFIAIRRDSLTYKLYIDSAIPVDTAIGIITKYKKLVIGANSDGTSAFEGSADEVKLFDYAIEENSFNRDMVPFGPLKLTLSKNKLIMKLKWLDQSINESGFVVERKINDGDWEDHAGVGQDILTFSDTVELYNTQYTYRIRAINQFGNSKPSNSVSVLSPLDPATGIREVSSSSQDVSAFVYPNPFTDKFTFVSDENSYLVIYDLQGRPVLEKKNSSPDETIDFSDFSKGVYFLKPGNRKNAILIKIIKL